MRTHLIVVLMCASLLVGVRPSDAGPLHAIGTKVAHVARQVGHAFVVGAEAAAVTAAVVAYIAARSN